MAVNLNKPLKKIIRQGDWIWDLTRPMNLLTVSLWHHAYSSDEAKKIVGAKIYDSLIIEEKKGLFSYYKKSNQLANFNKYAVRALLNDRKTLKCFSDAKKLNKRAINLLNGKDSFKNFKEATVFFKDLLFKSTIFPFRVSKMKPEEVRQLNPKVLNFAKKLRAISYYPLIADKILKIR